MTQEQASECWCPFARSFAQGPQTDLAQNRNSDGTPDPGSKCLGSSCMAWRWQTPPEAYQPADEHKATGYCGLAGPVRA